MTQISLSLKSSLVLWPKWILHPPERPPHSVLTHPCSQVCVSVVMSKAGKETLRQADWFRNFKKENWLPRIQYFHNQQNCQILFLEAGWGEKDLLESTCSFFPFQLFNRSIRGGICPTQCYRTLALVVGFFELGRHQLSCRFSRDAGLGGRGSKNWGAVLATPHLGENRQLRVLYLCNKKVRVKMESSGGTSQPQTMWLYRRKK